MGKDPTLDLMLEAEKINTLSPDLVFDDEPVDSIIDGEGLIPPTPADIIELWSYADSQDISTEAIAHILCNHPEAASRIKNKKKAEETLWNALESVEDHPECLKTAIFLSALSSLYRGQKYQYMAINLQRCAVELCLKNVYHSDKHSPDIINNYITLLESRNNFIEADRIRRSCQVEELLKRGDQNSLIELRTMALNLFKKRNYQEAIMIYRRLLDMGFEIPGTLSHLARVLLAMPSQDHRKEAKELLEDAWKNRKSAPAYVPPRILLWQTLLNFLDRVSSSNTIGMLKSLLDSENSNVFLEYCYEPVLDRWKTQLFEEEYNLLNKIASALNSRQNLAALKGWRIK